MKTEFLQNFKVGDQALPKEVVDAILAENGRDVESAKAKYADYDTLKAQLAEAGKTIEGFEGMDVETIRKEANEWKAKAEQAEQDAAAKIADMEFDTLLSGAVAAAKGKNAKAIRALLDVNTLKGSKNQTEDIKVALEAIKTENAYLFDADGAHVDSGAGHGSGGGADYSKMSDEEYYTATMKKKE